MLFRLRASPPGCSVLLPQSPHWSHEVRSGSVASAQLPEEPGDSRKDTGLNALNSNVTWALGFRAPELSVLCPEPSAGPAAPALSPHLLQACSVSLCSPTGHRLAQKCAVSQVY